MRFSKKHFTEYFTERHFMDFFARLDRKVIESAVVAGFALAVFVTAAANGGRDSVAEQNTKEIASKEEVSAPSKERAEMELVSRAAGTEAAGAEAAVVDVPVAASAEAIAEVPAPEPAPASEWDSKLMPNVEESLNIRAEASAEAELAGKLYKGAVADVVERGEEWTKISSGNVEGYVKNEFCVFGQEAEAMAHEQGTVYATALTGGLRVRQQADASEEVKVCAVLDEGEKVKVNVGAEAPEGWVAVLYSDEAAYVSAEYVSVELELGKAISIEEELAAIRKAEEEEAARRASQQPSRTQREAVEASYDDLTLLGALIQCEAGGESYEGQVAVGAVVMNRLRNGWADSIAGVIYQSGQFGPASSGKLARRLASGVNGSCMQAAQEALNGVDNVGGALFFRSTSCGRSGIVIGTHVFW